MGTLINSPLEQFEVTSLLSFNAPIFGYFTLTLTNLALYSIIIFFLIILSHFIWNNDLNLMPSKGSIALESIFATIHGIVRAQMGQKAKFIYLLFIQFSVSLISNLVGSVSYSFTITTSAILCLGLSFTILVAVTMLGFYNHKLAFFSLFLPSGAPIVLISLLVLIETVSFVANKNGIRLFANLVAGHALLAILSGLLMKLFTAGIVIAILSLVPFAIFTALVGLELAVAFIQAYIFTLLVCFYINDAIELHSLPAPSYQPTNNITPYLLLLGCLLILIAFVFLLMDNIFTHYVFNNVDIFRHYYFPVKDSASNLSSLADIKPVKVYENVLAIKDLIISENKGLSGVYQINLLGTGESYVGSSVNLAIRLGQYMNVYYLENLPYTSHIARALLT